MEARQVMKGDVILDCYGLLCPMPIIETARKMNELQIGEILEIISTDPGIKEDMSSWCQTTGQEFLGYEEEGEVIKVYVKKRK